MALTEQVQLDIQNAQRQIDALERQIAGLSTPVNVPVDFGVDPQAERSIDSIRSDIEQTVAAMDRLGDEMALVNAEAGGAEAEIRDLARAMGIAESDADAMVRQFAEGRVEAIRLEQATREVASALDLSEKDAAALTNELRKAARASDDIGGRATQTGGGIAGLGVNLRSLLGTVAAYAGAREFINFAKDSIGAASDLEESTSKAQVVFGDFFGDIERFASTAPQALGLANAQALEFTGTFGNLFVALGLSQQAAADLAPEIVQLGADLASFNNLEVTDALDKLRAGLVGEAEPLRALGVNLTAATVEAKALELGLGSVSGEVSEAAKVQARYALILEQTTTAQGDFERTSGGIANTQRTLAGEFENLRATIGEALLPAFAQLLESAGNLIPTIENLIPVFGFLGEVIAGTLTSVEPFAQLLGALADPITDIDAALSGIEGDDPFAGLSQSARNLFDNSQHALPLLEELKTLLETGIDAATFRRGFADFVDALEDGADPLQAAIDLAARFAEEGEITARVLDAIAESANLSDAQLRELLRTLLQGDFGIPALTDPKEIALFQLLLGDLNSDIQATTDAAKESGPAFTGFADAVREASPEIARFSQVLAGLDFETELNRIEAQFDRLPDGLDAAAAALRDEENEIVTDFTDFLDDLDDQIAARQAFRSNLELLEAFGLDQLAEVFREEGLDAAAALADAVANPEEARRAEALLDAEAEAIAQSFRETLAAAIIGESLDLTVPVNITAAIQSLILAGIPGLQAAGIVGASGAGPNVGGGVTVNQTFTDPTTPTTEAARAAQSVNSLVNVR